MDLFDKSLTRSEIEKFMAGVKRYSRNGDRDACLVWLMYRHGLRVSEALALHWRNINWEENSIYIKRAKGSISGHHPLTKDDRYHLNKLRKVSKFLRPDDYLFMSEQGTPLGRGSVSRILKYISESTRMRHVHAHMFRHSCGNHMAEKGITTVQIQQWLGHRQINNTVIYTEQAARKFDDLKEWW